VSFGLDENGLTVKTIDDVLTAIRNKQQTLFGAAFAAQLDSSVVGQLNGVFANEIADLWDLAQAVYRSRFPSTASGQSLDLVAEETGAIRLPATKSTVTLTFAGDNGTVIPTGTIARVTATDARFITIADGTISAGTASIAAESEEYGPVIGAAGTIDDIVTPVSGVDSVTNALDAAVGRLIETDAAFRIRRAGLVQQQGTGTIDAIRSDLLAVSGVTEVAVFNNPTDSTVDSIPPHSFEAVVSGGTDQAIWDQVLLSSPAGIQSYGSEVGTSVDVQGDDQTVAFTRPTEVLMYAEVEVTVDPDTYPLDGDAQIKQAIVDYWKSFVRRLGKDVINNAFYGSIYAISGVLEVTSLEIDDTTPTTSTPTTTIGPRAIAVFDTSRITVTST
jgi:uncharacterized phage protein gp47/JayE